MSLDLLFDEGPNGAPIPVEDPIIEVTGAVFTNDSIQGPFACDVNAGDKHLRAQNNGTVNHSFSIYGKIRNNPGSGSGRLIAITDSLNGIIASIRAHNDGFFDLANTSNIRQDVSTLAYVINQNWRIDGQWDQSTTASPILTVRVFITDPASETPDDTLSFTASGVAANQARWQLGIVGPTGWSAVLDTFRVRDGLLWIGPFAVFEPTLAGSGSLADQILQGLINQGFTTGSLADRERARLLAKLTLSEPQALTIQDLYDLADEPNRLAGLVIE